MLDRIRNFVHKFRSTGFPDEVCDRIETDFALLSNPIPVPLPEGWDFPFLGTEEGPSTGPKTESLQKQYANARKDFYRKTLSHLPLTCPLSMDLLHEGETLVEDVRIVTNLKYSLKSARLLISKSDFLDIDCIYVDGICYERTI